MTENAGFSENFDGFEEARREILAAALQIAPFDGWNSMTFSNAVDASGVDSATATAALPGGFRDLLKLWSDLNDAEMLEAMKAPEFATLKIREKVAFAVRARLAALRPHKEAVRRAAAFLALPTAGGMGPRLAWATADAIWRGLDDKSTDFNFYSKRGILAGVWTSTFARWLADESADEAQTISFLDARIENVMQIEKVKARVRDLGIDPVKPIEFLAKLRYPAR